RRYCDNGDSTSQGHPRGTCTMDHASHTPHADIATVPSPVLAVECAHTLAAPLSALPLGLHSTPASVLAAPTPSGRLPGGQAMGQQADGTPTCAPCGPLQRRADVCPCQHRACGLPTPERLQSSACRPVGLTRCPQGEAMVVGLDHDVGHLMPSGLGMV